MADQQISKTVNGLDTEVLAQTVSAVEADPALGRAKFRVRNRWVDGGRNTSTVGDFYGAGQENAHAEPYEMHADEPPVLAGQDTAPNPVEHLLHALASCVTTSIVAHAAVRGIALEEVESELEGDLDLRGFLGLDPDVPKGYTGIRMRLKVKAAPEDIPRLKELAEYSPVYSTLTHGVPVSIDVEPTP